MKTFHAYPAKCRFYSPGRWEVWNRFRSTSTMTKNLENALRVKGTYSLTQNFELNSSSFAELSSNRFPDTNRVKIIHSKMNSIQRTPNKIVIQENLPEKYTYSHCINKFDICGKTVNKSPEKPRSTRKKTRNLYFRLPVVSCTFRKEFD
jgi:hypothetical protein